MFVGYGGGRGVRAVKTGGGGKVGVIDRGGLNCVVRGISSWRGGEGGGGRATCILLSKSSCKNVLLHIVGLLVFCVNYSAFDSRTF